MKRFVSIWLIDWPITVWLNDHPPAPAASAAPAGPPEAPFALVERTGAGLVLAALNPAARRLGLRLHQSHADACAIVPALMSAPAELARAAAALGTLGAWLERYSPLVSLDPAPDGLEGLFVEITGCQHLFGGEAAMLAELALRLERNRIPARLAAADTAGAAWALARHGRDRVTIAPPGGTRQALAELPVAGLRLPGPAVTLLNRFGLRRIGALYALPRAALTRRFRDEAALAVPRRLDQALGALAEPLTPLTPPPPHAVRAVFAEPVTNLDVVAAEAATLAARLGTELEHAGRGARRLRLTGFRADGVTTAIEVALAAPSCRPDHLVRLIKDKGWERLDLGFGIDALLLSAPLVEPLLPTQIDALDRQRGDADHAALIDRLVARLGQGAVLRPHLSERWLPEAAARLRPWTAMKAPLPEAQTVLGPRPVLLFDPPEPIETVAELPDGAPARFVWRRVARPVARASGPERLAPEWWRETGVRTPRRTRDYYRLEDEAGGRYWVFRDGLYDQGATPPRWWLHGLFA